MKNPIIEQIIADWREKTTGNPPIIRTGIRKEVEQFLHTSLEQYGQAKYEEGQAVKFASTYKSSESYLRGYNEAIKKERDEIIEWVEKTPSTNFDSTGDFQNDIISYLTNKK